jgi:hypothetical protein
MSRFSGAVANTNNNPSINGHDSNDDMAIGMDGNHAGCCGGNKCQWFMRHLRLHLRSFIAFNGAIIFWTGLWDLLDLYIADASPSRDTLYSIAGIALLLLTNTFFVTVGIDQELLRSGRPRYCVAWSGRSRLMCRSMGSLAGSVAFWVGMYNIFDQHITEPTLSYDMLCFFIALLSLALTSTLLGTAGLSSDGDDTPELIELAAASTKVKAKLYCRGLIAAVAAVLLWKGCSSTLNNHIADESMGELIIAIISYHNNSFFFFFFDGFSHLLSIAREFWYLGLGFAGILAANSLIEVLFHDMYMCEGIHTDTSAAQ